MGLCVLLSACTGGPSDADSSTGPWPVTLVATLESEVDFSVAYDLRVRELEHHEQGADDDGAHVWNESYAQDGKLLWETEGDLGAGETIDVVHALAGNTSYWVEVDFARPDRGLGSQGFSIHPAQCHDMEFLYTLRVVQREGGMGTSGGGVGC